MHPYFGRPSTNSYVETYHASGINIIHNLPDLPPYCPAIAPDPIPLQTQPGMAQWDHWPSFNTPMAAARASYGHGSILTLQHVNILTLIINVLIY